MARLPSAARHKLAIRVVIAAILVGLVEIVGREERDAHQLVLHCRLRRVRTQARLHPVPPELGHLDVILKKDGRRRVVLVGWRPRAEHVRAQPHVCGPPAYTHRAVRPAHAAHQRFNLVVDRRIACGVQRKTKLDRRRRDAVISSLDGAQQPGQRSWPIPCARGQARQLSARGTSAIGEAREGSACARRAYTR
eukprot:817948-Prymnesium_polylepis.1